MLSMSFRSVGIPFDLALPKNPCPMACWAVDHDSRGDVTIWLRWFRIEMSFR